MAARRADTPPPPLRLVRDGEGVAAPLDSAEPWRPGLCTRCTRRRKVRNRALCGECLTYEFPFLAVAPAGAPTIRPRRARCAAPAQATPPPPPRRRPPRQLDLIERHRHLEVYGSRPRSLRRQKLTRKERAQFKVDRRYLQRQGVYAHRAQTWGECQERNPAGPCGWVSCSMNLFLEVDEEGIIKENFPGRQVWELEETCALRVAAEGEHTLERVGEILNITQERVRQLQDTALQRLEKFGRRARGEELDEENATGD